MSSLSVLKLCISSVVMIFVFLVFKYSPAVALYFFNFIRHRFKSLLLLPVRWCHLHILLLISLPLIFTSSYESSLVFHICSVYRVNKQRDKIYLCLTPLLIGNYFFSIFCPDSGFLSPVLHIKTIKC